MPPKRRKTPASANKRPSSKKRSVKRTRSPKGGYSATRACEHTLVDVGKVVAVPLAISKTGFAMVRKKESDSTCFYTDA